MEIKSYLERSEADIEKVIEKNLSYDYVDFEKSKMPIDKGIYFIYEKSTKDLVYIGCTTRTIRIRCGQYLQNAKRGSSFRNKIIKNILKKSPIKEIKDQNGNISRVKDKEVINEAINYIKENYCLKFITMDKYANEREIKLIERACILLKNPKFNDKYDE